MSEEVIASAWLSFIRVCDRCHGTFEHLIFWCADPNLIRPLCQDCLDAMNAVFFCSGEEAKP